jgi:hypothetical protein
MAPDVEKYAVPIVLLTFTPTFLYFIFTASKVAVLIINIISGYLFRNQLIYNGRIDELDESISKFNKNLKDYIYEINKNSIDIYFIKKINNNDKKTFKEKVTISKQVINVSDLENFLKIIDSKKANVTAEERNGVINLSAGNNNKVEKSQKYKIIKTFYSNLIRPYSPLVLILIMPTILISTTLSTLAGIVGLAINSIFVLFVSRVGFCTFATIIIIPLGILIAIIFVIKFIWIRV